MVKTLIGVDAYFFHKVNGLSYLTQYFELSEIQQKQFSALGEMYAAWNEKINVISRKDIDNIYPNHILHSLSIAACFTFPPKSSVLDFGTGGGFPGIPLAIFFPDTHFVLIDAIGKKIKVAEDIATQLKLKNVTSIHTNIKQYKEKHHYIVSRAVAPFPDIFQLVKKNILQNSIKEASFPNGIICLKGGNIDAETDSFKEIEIIRLTDYFSEPFFATKKVVYCPYPK